MLRQWLDLTKLFMGWKISVIVIFYLVLKMVLFGNGNLTSQKSMWEERMINLWVMDLIQHSIQKN